MDKETSDIAAKALAKLNALVDSEEIVIFNKEEAKALREVASLWAQVKAAAALGGSIGSALKWTVVFGAAWAAFRAGFFDWMREGLD